MLDTNTCIQYLNGRSVAIRDRLAATVPAEVALCSVVKAELLYGALPTKNPERTTAALRGFLAAFSSLPFDDRCAEACARIRADLAVQGTPIGSNDLLIASIAVANSMVLVTHNTREFGRIESLRLEDWEVGTGHS